MRRILVSIGYAIAGVLLTVGLSVGAYALAGRNLSEPARPLQIDKRLVEPTPEPKPPKPTPSPTKSASSGVDDKGGDNKIDDGDDNSGSGSSNSGSGSTNSGSGSSGSGSDDEPDDD